MAARRGTCARMLRGRRMQGLKRSCTDALDAAVRTRQRSEYQQQNQREGELGTAQHLAPV